MDVEGSDEEVTETCFGCTYGGHPIYAISVDVLCQNDRLQSSNSQIG